MDASMFRVSYLTSEELASSFVEPLSAITWVLEWTEDSRTTVSRHLILSLPLKSTMHFVQSKRWWKLVRIPPFELQNRGLRLSLLSPGRDLWPASVIEEPAPFL